MTAWKANWWRICAMLVSAVSLLGGIGNLADDDGGPLFGKVAYVVVSALGAAAVTAGLLIWRKSPRLGSASIGLGVLPGVPLLLLWWFPPIALVGALAVLVAVVALREFSAVQTTETVGT